MLWTDKAKKILEKYWGFSNLKEKQVEVINQLLLGNDVIGLLPTGYGKSMCYLIPPLVTKKAIIIISPLISLMQDQETLLASLLLIQELVLTHLLMVIIVLLLLMHGQLHLLKIFLPVLHIPYLIGTEQPVLVGCILKI